MQTGAALTVKEIPGRGDELTMMATALTNDPVLGRFPKALGEVYGSRLERVVLYGSRARGDARPDSDYDVAVFLRDMNDLGTELHRLADLRARGEINESSMKQESSLGLAFWHTSGVVISRRALSTGIIEETGEFVHAMPYRAGAYDERTPLMLEIRTDGVDL
jgi:predicted nucleotidyltransferase